MEIYICDHSQVSVFVPTNSSLLNVELPLVLSQFQRLYHLAMHLPKQKADHMASVAEICWNKNCNINH